MPPSAPPPALAGLVRGLHHVAIVVPSIEGARGTYGTLGLAAGEVEHVADQRVNVLVLMAGAQRIELVEPASPDSPVTKFLEKSGGGLHHLAWQVEDCAAAVRELVARGVRMIDEAPRPGAHGTTIAFVHPKATGGVLMELVEEPRAHQESTR
ncbi:MAG: methylmalonyl-CoA epimerase [Planctomycetia bacterium]|jgi:methylmalonyl-CoA/ethylmalonyl-CoA epimerase